MRGLLVAVGVLVPSIAHAGDGFSQVDVGITSVSVRAPGKWARVGTSLHVEVWADSQTAGVLVDFTVGVKDICPAGNPFVFFAAPFQTVDVTSAWLDPGTGADGSNEQVNICIQIGELAYGVAVSLPRARSMPNPEYYHVRELVRMYARGLRARHEPAPAETVEVPAETAPDETAPADDGWQPSPPSEPEPVKPRRYGRDFLHWLPPRTFMASLVRRADEMGDSGWGGGLSISRLPWRAGGKRGVGYDVSVAGASQWFAASAQLRPGVSTGQKGSIGDLYLALGIDGTSGEVGPDVPFAPVAGVGVDLIRVIPGFGVEASAQVLADPDGLHAYSVGAGLVLGGGRRGEAHFWRLGARYVDTAEAGTVWWLNIGVTDLAGED